MTCGFFILSVPCLPKLLSETITSPRLKKLLGITMESDSKKSPNPTFSVGLAFRKKSKTSNVMLSNSYYEMDDVTIKASESKEQLRKQPEHSSSDHDGIHVTRTTEIGVSNTPPGLLPRSGIHPWSSADAWSRV